MAELHKYTVFGLYEDTEPPFQRWCDSYDARDPMHAQELALADAASGLLIAAVVEGDATPVDQEIWATDEPDPKDYLTYRYGQSTES